MCSTSSQYTERARGQMGQVCWPYLLSCVHKKRTNIVCLCNRLSPVQKHRSAIHPAQNISAVRVVVVYLTPHDPPKLKQWRREKYPTLANMPSPRLGGIVDWLGSIAEER